MAKERAYTEFTKKMKKDYTVLIPNMSTIHFKLIKNVLTSCGFKAELLTTTDRRIIDEGLKYVHNDTCYPALLAIGQLMDALQSGKYDTDRIALMMSQTGGGCRASNYIHLLRKALKKAGLEHVPVISISFTGLEKHSGFKFTLSLIQRCLAALTYGDMLLLLSNQTKPYEVNSGATDALLSDWIEKLSILMSQGKAYSRASMEKQLASIAESFAGIDRIITRKTKVGIVGEIYVKYSPLANNHLEDFLHSQDCEVMVPGIMGFMLYCAENAVEDINLYGGSTVTRRLLEAIRNYLCEYADMIIRAVEKQETFTAPWPHKKLFEEGTKVIGSGCKMGEGWLLTAEMVELIRHGYSNIVCTQPFGCLPNHIVGKGMIRKLREIYEHANIVTIDYDPGATRVNQENRIKLMLAVAKEQFVPAYIRVDS